MTHKNMVALLSISSVDKSNFLLALRMAVRKSFLPSCLSIHLRSVSQLDGFSIRDRQNDPLKLALDSSRLDLRGEISGEMLMMSSTISLSRGNPEI